MHVIHTNEIRIAAQRSRLLGRYVSYLLFDHRPMNASADDLSMFRMWEGLMGKGAS